VPLGMQFLGVAAWGASKAGFLPPFGVKPAAKQELAFV
jgi:hypothetical protein